MKVFIALATLALLLIIESQKVEAVDDGFNFDSLYKEAEQREQAEVTEQVEETEQVEPRQIRSPQGESNKWGKMGSRYAKQGQQTGQQYAKQGQQTGQQYASMG